MFSRVNHSSSLWASLPLQANSFLFLIYWGVRREVLLRTPGHVNRNVKKKYDPLPLGFKLKPEFRSQAPPSY